MSMSQRTGPWLGVAVLILGICLVVAARILTSPDRVPLTSLAAISETRPTIVSSSQALPVLSPNHLSTGDLASSTNVAAGKPVIAHAGGIDYPQWGNANDQTDYNTTTHTEGGRWGNNTNGGGGSFEVVDLEAIYSLTGVGYSLDWDGSFQNPLIFQVDVSTDNEYWTTFSRVIHRHSKDQPGNFVSVDIVIPTTPARYVRYSMPPDGSWNGWGDLFQLRAYASQEKP